MSDKEELLSQEELGFLLTDYETGGDEQRDSANDPWSSADADAVTLRGDLIDTSFQDLLQSVTDDEGVLRLLNPMEEHYLHIRSGSVQDLVVKRHVGRRVGQRLIAAGDLGETQLEEALRIHKRDGHPLGKVLVSQGFANAEQVGRQIEEQSVEDFYSLFTWSIGQFEYRPGPPAPEHREAFAVLPQFDIERVVSEVADRREEWDRILCAPEGLESVVKPLRAAAVRLPAAHATILRNLNGEQSLRELAETTMLGLFECARAVKDLYDWKMVESAEPAQLLTIARSRLVSGEPKRAAMILQSLWTRLDPTDHEFAGELADALQRCGENRIAARCLLRTAEHCDLAQEALEFARKAHKADPRSLEVLTFLRDRLLDANAEDGEASEIACALTDALAREEKFEEALEVITPFAKARHESVIPFGRKVRLLCRLGSPQEAVSELLELAEHYKGQGDRHRQAGVYEHILRIDGDRADLVAKIKALKPKTRKPAFTSLRLVILVVAAGISGLVYMDHQSSEKLRALTARVNAHLDRGDADRALGELDADEEFIGDPVTDSLRARAVGILHRRATEERNERNMLLADFSRAAEHMENGELERALRIYGERLARPDQKNQVLPVVQRRFNDLARRLEDLARAGERRLPPVPDALMKEKRLRLLLDRLDEDFEEGMLAEAQGLLAVRDHPVLLECLGEEKIGQVADAAEKALGFLRIAEVRKQQFRVRLTERIKKRDLIPPALSAEEHLKKHQFREALEKYEELIERYPDKTDPILIKFKSERDRCDDIVQTLDVLTEATGEGDARIARSLLKSLKARWPNVPWDELVDLPLSVESVPQGAKVSVNGVQQGSTRPRLLVRYRPADSTEVEVSLDGYVSRGRTLEGHEDVLRVILPRKPDWEAKTDGVVMSRARAQTKNPLIFVTDRSGTLTALDPFGGTEWRLPTKDLNGLLPTPVLFEDSVIITSLDGMVRCFDTSSAELLWEIDSVECQGAPVLAGGLLVAGNVDGRVVFLDPANEGAQRHEKIRLRGRLETDLVADGHHVFATTDNGWLVCINSSTGKLEWEERVGVANGASPCVTDEVVVGVTIGGIVLAVDRETRKPVWPKKHGIGEIELVPARAGEFVFVASENQLVSFRLWDGKRGPRHRGTEMWSAGPVVVEDKLLIGDRKGTVYVFETEKLGLLYTMQGKAKVTSISSTPLGTVVAFDDKTIQFFERL